VLFDIKRDRYRANRLRASVSHDQRNLSRLCAIELANIRNKFELVIDDGDPSSAV
jgi:hypothetical protein